MAYSVQTAVLEQKSLCPKAAFDLVRHWEGLTHPSHRPSLKMQQLPLVLPTDMDSTQVAWADQAAAADYFA